MPEFADAGIESVEAMQVRPEIIIDNTQNIEVRIAE